jgi:hypothetical protein
MSRMLLDAEEDYIRSPVDDLEAIFWVAVWSVFFNEENKGKRSVQEQKIMDALVGNRKGEAMIRFSVLPAAGKLGNVTQHFESVLFDWWIKVEYRPKAWAEQVERCCPTDAGGEYYLPHFHKFALQGVLDVLRVLAAYWDETNQKSWAAPVPPM